MFTQMHPICTVYEISQLNPQHNNLLLQRQWSDSRKIKNNN